MFLFKKVVASFLLPLPLCLGLLFIGLGLLWFTRRQRSGKILVSAGAGLLLVLSYSAVSDMALRPLELKYPPVADSDAGSGGPQDGHFLGAGSYIVVLGGGINRDATLPATSQIGSQSLSRLLEGVRLYRAEPGRKLILSGGPVFSPISESQVMSRVALIMGVNPRDILQESVSRDTEEQARLLKPLVGRERFFLVTSAAHMPRAMALFRRQGLEPVAAPAGLPAQQTASWSPEYFFPGSLSLQRMEIALHEYLGLAAGGHLGRSRAEPDRGRLAAGATWSSPATPAPWREGFRRALMGREIWTKYRFCPVFFLPHSRGYHQNN